MNKKKTQLIALNCHKPNVYTHRHTEAHSHNTIFSAYVIPLNLNLNLNRVTEFAEFAPKQLIDTKYPIGTLC